MITTGYAQVFDELAATVDGVLASVLTLVYEDVPSDLPAGGSWARFSARVTSATPTLPGPTGTRLWETTGTLLVEIFTPRGEGSNLSHQYGTMVVEALRGLRTSPGGVLVKDPHVQPGGTDGDWSRLNVLADISYDEVQ